MTTSRDIVLGRIRDATAHTAEPAPPRRDHRTTSPLTGDALTALLAERLADYRATVHRCDDARLPALLAALTDAHPGGTVVPPGLPGAWLARAASPRLTDDAAEPLTTAVLDTAGTVVTGCALAVAETGTIVLDAGPAQGRRALTLVPDRHICVIRAPGQIVASVPQALERLDPRRPLTWISGPSATSDIELDRVEGVHGPRTLHAILVTWWAPCGGNGRSGTDSG